MENKNDVYAQGSQTPEEKIHLLKTWPEYFRAIKTAKKPFEVRRNDRDYKVGDILILQEYDIESKTYTGDEYVSPVTYILYGPAFGIEDGFCVMGLYSYTQENEDLQQQLKRSREENERLEKDNTALREEIRKMKDGTKIFTSNPAEKCVWCGSKDLYPNLCICKKCFDKHPM